MHKLCASSISNQAGLTLIFKKQTKQHFHERRRGWQEEGKEGGNIFPLVPSGLCFSPAGEVFDAGMKSGACKAQGSSCLRGKVKWMVEESRASWKSAQKRINTCFAEENLKKKIR